MSIVMLLANLVSIAAMNMGAMNYWREEWRLIGGGVLTTHP